jgi:hypothetical protein
VDIISLSSQPNNRPKRLAKSRFLTLRRLDGIELRLAVPGGFEGLLYMYVDVDDVVVLNVDVL